MRYTTSRLAIATAFAATMAVGVVAPALADVTVTVDVSKDKTITVEETISITKTVFIDADIFLVLDGAAEAQALANIRNQNNTVIYNDDDADDIDFSAVIDSSVLANAGIVGVNQDVGYNAKQGNVVALAFTDSGNAFANSQAEADQINSGHTVLEGPANPPLPPGAVVPDPVANPPGTVQYQALITNGSISGLMGAGIVGVNQNAGNNNSQLNMVAVAAAVDTEGTDVTAALSEAALGQQNGGPEDTGGPGSGNSVTESGTIKFARINGGSLSNNVGGIIGVNQAAGNNANQGNLVSLAAAVTP